MRLFDTNVSTFSSTKTSVFPGALFTIRSLDKDGGVTIEWGKETQLSVDSKHVFQTSNDVCRYLARIKNIKLYGGTDICAQTEVCRKNL